MNRKMIRACLLLCTMILAVPGADILLNSRELTPDTVTAVTGEPVVGESDVGPADMSALEEEGGKSIQETWYQFYEKGRPISDIIALVFLLGLIFVLDEVRKIFFDSMRSRSLRAMNIQKADLEAISKQIERQPNTQLSRLLSALLSSYNTTGSVAGIFQEVNLYIQHLQDQFNSFRSRLDLLSDSAGALGLLGTVWGIFITFEVENWTQDTVLRGMGLALVTTFIGIIVSLILNLLSTEVFNYFNRRNDMLQMKSKDLRGNIFQHHIRRNGNVMAGAEKAREVKL